MIAYTVIVSLFFIAALIIIIVLFRKLRTGQKKSRTPQESRPEPVTGSPAKSGKDAEDAKKDKTAADNTGNFVPAVNPPSTHRVPAAGHTPSAPVKEEAAGAHYSHESHILKGARVLAVEDNVMNLTIVEDILEGNGCVVTTAANGRIALETFEASAPGSFDLILMDIMMPEMNGLEATKAIRALDRSDAKTIPVIALTANAFAEDIAASVAAGMDAHLIKPIDVPELIGTLSSYYHK